MPLPCALVLFYPALNFALSPSPSRAVHLCDPILPLGVVTAITKAFVPPHVKDPSKVTPHTTQDTGTGMAGLNHICV